MSKHIGSTFLYFSIAVMATAIIFISPGGLRAAGAGYGGIMQAAARPARKDLLRKPAASKAGARVLKTYARLPLYFIANRGQVNSKAAFYETGPGHAIFFTRKGIVLSLRKGQGKVVRIGQGAVRPRSLPGKWSARSAAGLRFARLRVGMPGIDKEVQIVPEDAQPGKVNYFIGKDPSKWRTDIPTYGAVLYKNAYPGIDLKFYGKNRRLEYDIIVKPGADPSKVAFKYSGAKDVHVTAAGDLAIELDGGSLVMKKPNIYQEVNGRRVLRRGKFEVRQDKPAVGPGKAAHAGAKLRTFTCSFDVGAYDRKIPLVIDPVLVYSTYLGGSGDDAACAVAVDGSGDAYIAGQTSSAAFFDNGLQTSVKGGYDAFVAEIAAGGQSLVYATYLGGSNDDTAFGIAVDSSGNAYVAGETLSGDFPVSSGAYQQTYGGGTNWGDAFVTEIAAGGKSLVYSTYLGGSGDDAACAIAVDGSGNAYVAGETQSNPFPTTVGAYQQTYGGGISYGDAFVAEIAAGGKSLVYSTYLGGSGDDAANSIVVDSSGNAYVAGWTKSTVFPTKNALYSSLTGSENAFVTEIAAGGTNLVYSTYLGGSGGDGAYSIAVDSSGNAYVTGWTESSDFPIKNALYSSLMGTENAFVTEIAAGGQSLVYSTYLGGSTEDLGTGIAVDSSGNVYVTGDTLSTDFPTTSNASQTSNAGGTSYGDAFLTEIAPGGGSLLLSTYLGGGGDDLAYAIAVDRWGDAYVTGATCSTDFPTHDALQSASGGGYDDAFLAKFAGLWRDAPECGGGWLWLRNFGYFCTGNSFWIYHLTLGWLYPMGTSTDSIWFYDSAMGAFWWTSATVYPNVYRASDGAWLWYDVGTSNPRWFYNYKTRQWETH